MSQGMDIRNSLSLEGKIAVVTGGAGGIGSVTVDHLQAAGARVICLDLPGKTAPDGAIFKACDFSDPDQITNTMEEIRDEVAGFDILVHCAGITRDRVLWKMTDEEWDTVFEVNLDSAFFLLRAATPFFRERGDGRVVLISSINGERGKLGQANYAASKAGLIALGRTAARELGRFGVRVNCIAPGLILTSLVQDLPDEVLAKAREEIVLGRAGKPLDVANAVLFLCSDMSAHITGQVLRVDGGQLMA
jgi:3-oxoacyl-[acyl-carrier protein] reductase